MSGLSVLIVDDSEADRLFNRIQLKRSGLFEEIGEVKNGLEALRLFENAAKTATETNSPVVPQVLFLDINMPVMNGFEFLEELTSVPKEFQPSVVVMLTSSDLNEDQERANSFEVVKGYVTKPVSQAKLKELEPLFLNLSTTGEN